jgi:hypothetical protein
LNEVRRGVPTRGGGGAEKTKQNHLFENVNSNQKLPSEKQNETSKRYHR